MALIVKRKKPSATLSEEDKAQLIADEAALTNGDGYQFIWGFVSKVPLRDTHFPNTDNRYSFVYLKDTFENYILIEDLSDTVLRHEMKYLENTVEKSEGKVCKIPLDSGIKYYQAELNDDGSFKKLSDDPIDIEELGSIEKYEALKSSTTQSIFSVRRAYNL